MSDEELRKTLAGLKQAFFAYRNGVVADALRRSGDPHHYIMGCQLADLAQIARANVPNARLAEALWAERGHRECRLIATMLYPDQEMDNAAALRWARDVQCAEEADVLCHRLLRRLPCAGSLWRQLLGSAEAGQQYVALRLLLNLLLTGRETDSQSAGRLVHGASLCPTAAIEALLRDIDEELT